MDHLTAENRTLVEEITSLRAKLRDPERLTAVQEAAVEAARADLVQALSHLESLRLTNGHGGGGVNGVGQGRSGVGLGQERSYAGQESNGAGQDRNGVMPPPQRQYSDTRQYSDSAVTMSPAVSVSSNASIVSSGGTPPPRAMPVFDPNCCDGLFDCSALPGVPVSDMRSVRQMMPPPPDQYVFQRNPMPAAAYEPPHPAHPPHPGANDDCCMGLVNCEPPDRRNSQVL